MIIQQQQLALQNAYALKQAQINDQLKKIDVESITNMAVPAVAVKKIILTATGGYNNITNLLILTITIIGLIILTFIIYILQKPSIDGSWTNIRNKKPLIIQHNRFTKCVQIELVPGKKLHGYFKDNAVIFNNMLSLVFNPNNNDIDIWIAGRKYSTYTKNN
jgi:hypothetical protein